MSIDEKIEYANAITPNINKFIPNPNSNAQQITALVKQKGKVYGYQLSNGAVVSKDEGINLAKSGEIKNVAVGVRNGNEYLRGLPDGNQNNNLSSLPSVSQ